MKEAIFVAINKRFLTLRNESVKPIVQSPRIKIVVVINHSVLSKTFQLIYKLLFSGNSNIPIVLEMMSSVKFMTVSLYILVCFNQYCTVQSFTALALVIPEFIKGLGAYVETHPLSFDRKRAQSG